MEIKNSETDLLPDNRTMVEDSSRLISEWNHRRELDEIWGVKRDRQLDYARSLLCLQGTLNDILTVGNSLDICARYIARTLFNILEECHSGLYKLWTWLKELESSPDYPLIKEDESEKEKTLKWIDELDNSLTNEYLLRRTTLETFPIEASKYQDPVEMRVHVSAH